MVSVRVGLVVPEPATVTSRELLQGRHGPESADSPPVSSVPERASRPGKPKRQSSGRPPDLHNPVGADLSVGEATRP